MSANEALKQISYDSALALLQPGPTLSVSIVRFGGGLTPERWPRERVLMFLREHGPVLAGAEARRAHHGIAAYDRNKNLHFFETGHT